MNLYSDISITVMTGELGKWIHRYMLINTLTNYTVTIRSTNNMNLYSDISITVRTGELGKWIYRYM